MGRSPTQERATVQSVLEAITNQSSQAGREPRHTKLYSLLPPALLTGVSREPNPRGSWRTWRPELHMGELSGTHKKIDG